MSKVMLTVLVAQLGSSIVNKIYSLLITPYRERLRWKL
jgi:hypothetical protein